MNLIICRASVRSQGGIRGGMQAVTTRSRALRGVAFSCRIPLKNDSRTHPAELVAAAHAASFSLALARELGLKASAMRDVTTTATVAMERLAAGWTIMNIHLNVVAFLPHVTQGRFIDATIQAKTSCLVSRLLRATISMNAKLAKEPLAAAP